jgi:hypothetical protein
MGFRKEGEHQGQREDVGEHDEEDRQQHGEAGPGTGSASAGAAYDASPADASATG